MKPDDKTITDAMLGDPEAARVCTEAAYMIPCWACGCEHSFIRRTIGIAYKQVACKGCDAETDGFIDVGDAIAEWNRRADLRGLANKKIISGSPRVGATCDQHDRWISMYERRPNSDCIVYESNRERVMFAIHGEWEAESWNVTHWMPLPKPPKEVCHG